MRDSRFTKIFLRQVKTVKTYTVDELLSRLRLLFQGDDNLTKKYGDKEPLRSELFSSGQMEQYGKQLATIHKLSKSREPDQLLPRLADNERVLGEVRNVLTEAVKEGHQITPAGEWLLDNFYLIEEQIRTGTRHLPKGYSEALPRLANGSSVDVPRVYDIALGIISHSDGRVDLTSLSSFISAYQSITYLTIGELWAIPIMLRLALIENLRRVTAKIAIDRIDQNLAAYWANKLTATAEKNPSGIIMVIADMARSEPPMVSAFVAELIRRLQGMGPALALALTWIEQKLAETGLTTNEMVQRENQKQAADQVSMSNSIGSLRFLATMDWREFVETMSVLEQTLRTDINGTYSRMDFDSRDRYRHVIERIVKKSGLPEKEVAGITIELAKESALKNGQDDRTAHVGFFIIDEGLFQTERKVNMRLSVTESIRRRLSRYPLLVYAGSIITLSVILAGGLLAKAYEDGAGDNLLILVSILALLCASQFSVTMVNWIATLLVRPNLLPRMDFLKGIDTEFRTLVVVPSLITSEEEIEDLAEALEVRFLANRDEHLHFGLLTDFRDAKEQTLPEDELLLSLTEKKIKDLNQKYGREEHDLFFLFHRPRRWNARDKIWMGYERKRGKLAELNALLQGGSKDRFSLIVGEERVYTRIKYVITLDSDTQLPRDAARKIVGAIAHPLNRARYNEKKQRVTEGYGILQPQVAVSLPESNRSLYARVHGNESGIDPYTRSVSDVYQDLFGEGSFIGKGIYEVDTFEKSLNGRFPENRILSHDLLEGCYARSGLLSDVQVYEEFPSSYIADVNRRHRWIRGDWQIGRWLFPRVPGEGKRTLRNPISGLSRWKIFDNLRRSLAPVALVLLLISGWTVLPSGWFWTLSVLGFIILPSLITSVWSMLKKPKEVLLLQHIRTSTNSIFSNFLQTVFMLVCLPYEAYFSMDAILLTLWRMFASHRRLLEWTPSGFRRQNAHHDITTLYQTMWVGPFIALAVFIFLLISSFITLIISWPILFIWAMSPIVVWWVSRPLEKYEPKLSENQRIFLHKISRKTWDYFEKFIGPEDNWLPPDNYQEYPAPMIAHRTSPTNIGFSLLANLSAYDFGYLSAGQLIGRTSNTLTTLKTLERYRGHFCNWYDTRTLKPLFPKYISTVDSGNLSALLLTLRRGLLSVQDEKIIGSRIFDGLRDTFNILRDSIGETGSSTLKEFASVLAFAHENPPVTLESMKLVLQRMVDSSASIAESLKDGQQDGSYWAEALARQSSDFLNEILILCPWLKLSPTPEKFIDLTGKMEIPTLKELVVIENTLLQPEFKPGSSGNTAAEDDWLNAFQQSIEKASHFAYERILQIEDLAVQIELFDDIEYDFLYDRSKHLLSIGFNVDDQRRDSGFYDLLASEARLGLFTAISQGKLSQESWFVLGRLLTKTEGHPVLLSWSGSMFEYLMPVLVMPDYDNTLLDQTYKATVEKQIAYGRQRNTPWGISESGYNMVDSNLNYQYRAFGVPGLGLKRGLGEDLVIAPYASIMALMISPEEACENMEKMAKLGLEGKFGFYEAIDYTAARLPRGQSFAIVQSFMVHHQAMSLLSLGYLLLDRPMQKRFESEPRFQATLLLLQEKIPKATGVYAHPIEVAETITTSMDKEMRIITSPHTPVPEVQLLSNGRYHVMITNAGGGYSRWRDIALTRWREDSTCDNWGTFCYMRDVESGAYWSTAFQPTGKQGTNYKVNFSQGHAEFFLRENDCETLTEIVVSPEDDIEIRRMRITNRSRSAKMIDITSYAEVVIAPQTSDVIHPAFSNLFVQTEIIEKHQAILCTRRPRSVDEQPPWMFHLMKVYGTEQEEISFETSRSQFIGRGNSNADPDAVRYASELSGSQGSVLDPIVSIRYRIILEPRQYATVDMMFGIGENRAICQSMIEKYQDRHLRNRAFKLSWTYSQVVLRQINATETDAQLYEHLASHIIYANSLLRADPDILIRNHLGQSRLWSYSISGDLPIVLLRVEDQASLVLVKQLVQAHAYWRLKGLIVDLVIWNEDHSGYRQVLQDQILGFIDAGFNPTVRDRPGGIFVRSADQIPNEDRILLQTLARFIIKDTQGTLAEQIKKRIIVKTTIPRLNPSPSDHPRESPLPLPADLIFLNKLGGFSADGREYIISTSGSERTPAPWINVLANPNFGTIISESGSSYTWAENAHEFRLSPWNNDPIKDSAGEAFYIRDERTGKYWSATPLPARGSSTYITRHGFGYSIFEHDEGGIHTEMRVYVDLEEAIKFVEIKILNQSGRTRKLSATGYVEWVLGDLRPKSVMHVVTALDPETGVLFAKNPYNHEFPDRVAFFDVDDTIKTITNDRTEFIGRNGSLQNPDAMSRQRLSGKVGAGLDPCSAIQVPFDLADGQERKIIFRIGLGKNSSEAGNLANQFRGANAAQKSLQKVHDYWRQTLNTVKIETPDRALNILANGWLLYQTLACRLWARSGYYQSGGAFGFRDQLQDVIALMNAKPQLAREQILLCASRQFREGDVQHWWHPPTGRGVRTSCSDDFLWLPFVTCRYLTTTGDTNILEQPIEFLEGRLLNYGEESYYDLPIRSEQTASLYEHCKRAIQHALRFGDHGLPLIGSGDWNDGMNTVGQHGKGESVWLAFFLYDVLIRFIEIARLQRDEVFAEQCDQQAAVLRNNIEKNGWDGQWYRRAYFDDGTLLGSANNQECQIDSISQSWSVLSGAGDPKRSRTALENAEKRLVRRDNCLIQLLDPPFDKGNLSPGYIKGYVPGVRENGGQYTHAAIWMVMAFAKLGDTKKTWELFDMINPVNHGRSPDEIQVYKVEPYVVAADVYAVPPHNGRGGWTWYTGSAGWMYQLIVESIIGLKRERDTIRFVPCIPPGWDVVTIHYRFHETFYEILISQTQSGNGEVKMKLDDIEQPDKIVQLVDDKKKHFVVITLDVGRAELVGVGEAINNRQ